MIKAKMKKQMKYFYKQNRSNYKNCKQHYKVMKKKYNKKKINNYNNKQKMFKKINK
jgi:hypothetical protein